MIDIKTIGSIALRAVRANKLRSTLTSLGIIIGVAAVIVMLAVGNGAQISIQQDMQAMGSNLIIVRSGVATSSGARGGHGSQPAPHLRQPDDSLPRSHCDGCRPSRSRSDLHHNGYLRRVHQNSRCSRLRCHGRSV